jgi:hypothetical protein
VTLCAWVRYFERIVSLQTQYLSASMSNIVFFTLLQAVSVLFINGLQRHRPVADEKELPCFGYHTRVLDKVTQMYNIILFLVILTHAYRILLGILTNKKRPLRSSCKPERLTTLFLFSTSTHKSTVVTNQTQRSFLFVTLVARTC